MANNKVAAGILEPAIKELWGTVTGDNFAVPFLMCFLGICFVVKKKTLELMKRWSGYKYEYQLQLL